MFDADMDGSTIPRYESSEGREIFVPQKATLIVDLAAIGRNYKLLNAFLGAAECAAVVKADAYGLGAAVVASYLATQGCNIFFVANLEEGVALRPHLRSDKEILLLQGVPRGYEEVAVAHRLTPVLNGLEQVRRWKRFLEKRNLPFSAVLHVDTGMSQMGLSFEDVNLLVSDVGGFCSQDVRIIMSQLACAEWRDELNDIQRERLVGLGRYFPQARASLVGSEGVFAGTRFHFDLARVGGALYGLAGSADSAHRPEPVVRLQAPVLQVRDVKTGQAVGYFRAYEVKDNRRIAIVAIGYSNGFPRCLGNRGIVHVNSQAVPLVGSVSMNCITIDVSKIPSRVATDDSVVDVFGPNQSIADFAANANMLRDEVLTSFGKKCSIHYLPDPQIKPWQ